MFAPPPPPSKRSKEVQFSTNPMRNNNHSRTASAPQSTTPRPFDANRNAPPNPTNPKSKPRRMSSRELMKSRPPPPSNRGPPPPGISFSKNPLKPKPPPPSKSKPSIPSTSSSTNRQKRAQTTGQKSNDSSLPQEIRTQSGSVVKLKITKSELNKNYRRGSVTDRYRRASIFNEIIKEQQKNKAAAAENGTAGSEQQHHRHHSSRVDMIQGTQNYGVNTQHRSRIMAFERVAHNEGVDHDDFIINPYCVASMPEPIRKAFVLKVCGIVLSQMLLMITVICIIKYSGLGAEIIKGYNMWSLLTTFIPLIFLAILMGVRKSHPWNLFVFSLFTLSWAYSLGIACVWLENRLFISVMGLTAMNTLSIMGFARYVDYDHFNFCNCSIVVGFLSFITIFISYGIYPLEPWGNHIWPAFISLIFGSWICWDLKAIQIDLTADEYIIGAVDLYLDILNMFLWALICCLHCFETIIKG